MVSGKWVLIFHWHLHKVHIGNLLGEFEGIQTFRDLIIRMAKFVHDLFEAAPVSISKIGWVLLDKFHFQYFFEKSLSMFDVFSPLCYQNTLGLLNRLENPDISFL